jgi:hypothetical protein
MAHNCPVDSDVSVLALLVPNVVASLRESSVGVGIEQIGSVAVVLPAVLGSMSTMSTHTSPHDWSVLGTHIDLVTPLAVIPGADVRHLVSVHAVGVVSVGRINLDPPVSTVQSLEGHVNFERSPVMLIRVYITTKLSVVVELKVAPAASSRVAQRMGGDSDISVLTGSELSVIGVLHVEELVGAVHVHLVGAVASPAATSVASVAFSFPECRWEFDF